MASAVRLCRLDELAEGTSRGFDPWREGRDTAFLVHRHGIHAYRDACPHWPGAPMAWRKDAYLSADGQRIVCAAHGAQFEIESGRCVLGPCIGERLQAVGIRIVDGAVWLTQENQETTCQFPFATR